MTVVIDTAALAVEQQILDSRNIDWEFGMIPLSKIDLERSLMWNARDELGGLNEHWVETYALFYTNKEELPPIICMNSGNGKLLVLSGHHRVAAAGRAGFNALPGYTTPTLSEPDRLYVITEANRTVGYGLSEAQRLESGLRHIRQGVSIAEAARRAGIDQQKLHRKVAQMQADDRIQRLSRHWSSLPVQARLRLNGLVNDETCKKGIDLALAANLSGNEASDLVRDVNKATTDKDREEVIASMWEIYRPRIESGGDRSTKRNSKSAGAYVGLMRASIARLANPEAKKHLADIVSTPKDGFDKEILAAEKFIISAADKIRQRHERQARQNRK